ncbi:MAG: DUF819 family protein [Lewinella sp.]|nr:DUF819 family protein [Lewinella sp.]
MEFWNEGGVWLSIVLCVGFPFLAKWAQHHYVLPPWLSSIVACYCVGILVSNLRLWAVPPAVVQPLAQITMLLGFPLLLFSIRLRESWQQAGLMLRAFALCCVAGICSTGLVGWWLRWQLEDGWKVAGMLTGLYTGGTPKRTGHWHCFKCPSQLLGAHTSGRCFVGRGLSAGALEFFTRTLRTVFTPLAASSGTAGTHEPHWAQSGTQP